MRAIEFRVFFGDPNGKKELITAEAAFSENYIHFVGNELRPTDECTEIYYVSDIIIVGNAYEGVKE